MRKTSLALVLGYCCLIPTVFADDLLTIYQLARTSDPIWLGQIAGNKATQETREQSFSALLPNITLSGDSKSNFQDQQFLSSTIPSNRNKFNSNRWSLDLIQPVFDLGSYRTHQQSKATVRQSDAQLLADTQEFIIRVVQTYLDILSRMSDLDSVKAEKKAIARQLDQAQKRFEVGLIAITDVHEAQASYDLVVAQEIEADNLLSLAHAALSEITGQPHGSLSDIIDDLPLVSPNPNDMEQWVAVALEANQSLLASKASVKAARENVKAQRAGHYPTLDFIASAGNSTTHGGTFGSNTDRSSIGLQLNIPIYSGGLTSSKVRQALAELEQAQQNSIQTKRSVVKLTRNAYRSIIADISRVKALKQAVISAQSAVDATEAGFEVGTRTIVDVLNVQRNLYRAKSDYRQAQYAYILNGLNLKLAAGSLSDDDVALVNNHLKSD